MQNDHFDTLDNQSTLGGSPGGQILSGRYKIVREIGAGGMGTVYLAEDLELDNMLVAIKVLPAILANNKRAIDNLRREAKTALKLTHTNIVRLYNFQSDEAIKYLVMEYVDGGSLEDKLAEGPLSVDATLKIFPEVAAGLDHAHSQGVLHRDIKPANIMLTKDGTAKLADFGIARELKDSMTRVTGKETSGTLLYMPPEQLRGGEPDHRSDIYSLAASIYECLCGHPPFWRGSVEHQVLNEQPVALSSLSDKQNEALMRSLSKQPEVRQSCARDLLVELGADLPLLSWQPKSHENTLSYGKTVTFGRESLGGNGGRRKTKASLIVFIIVAVAAIVGGFVVAKKSLPHAGQEGESQKLLSQAEPVKQTVAQRESLQKAPDEDKHKAATAEDGRDFDSCREAGLIFEASQGWSQAIDSYTRALEFRPEDAEIKDKLATCQHNLYLSQAQESESKGDLNTAMLLYGKALSYKQVASTRVKLGAARVEQRHQDCVMWTKEARDSEERGDLRAAVAFYQNAKQSAQAQDGESLQQRIDSINKSLLQTMLADLAKGRGTLAFDAVPGVIRLKSDFLFEKGSVVVAGTALETIETLCAILNSEEAKQFDIEIAGHTDTTPILAPAAWAKYPTGLYLSARQAISVIEMMAKNDLDPRRMSMRAFGQYRPISPNTAETKGDAEDRRIEIRCVPKRPIGPARGEAYSLVQWAEVPEAYTNLRDLYMYNADLGIFRFRSDLLFATASDEVSPSAAEALKYLCGNLNCEPMGEYDVMIVGYATGADARRFNSERLGIQMENPTGWYLAAYRAISVFEEMSNRIVPNRLSIQAFGEYLGSDQDTLDPKDRRVEIYVVPNGT